MPRNRKKNKAKAQQSAAAEAKAAEEARKAKVDELASADTSSPEYMKVRAREATPCFHGKCWDDSRLTLPVCRACNRAKETRPSLPVSLTWPSNGSLACVPARIAPFSVLAAVVSHKPQLFDGSRWIMWTAGHQR